MVCLGAIAGAYGVRGEVRLRCFTEGVENIAAYGPVRLGRDGPARAIAPVRAAKGGLIARVEGVATREDAAALKGVRLYVPRSALPEPEVDSYYHVDLEGLAVELPDGTPVGRVVAVFDFGAGDVLEIAVTVGADARAEKRLMVPFTRERVPMVDLENGVLRLAPSADVDEVLAARKDG